MSDLLDGGRVTSTGRGEGSTLTGAATMERNLGHVASGLYMLEAVVLMQEVMVIW